MSGCPPADDRHSLDDYRLPGPATRSGPSVSVGASVDGRVRRIIVLGQGGQGSADIDEDVVRDSMV